MTSEGEAALKGCDELMAALTNHPQDEAVRTAARVALGMLALGGDGVMLWGLLRAAKDVIQFTEEQRAKPTSEGSG